VWNKEGAMKTKAGLWIDHKKAVIVALTDKGAEIGLVLSKVESQLQRAGDAPLKGPYDPRQLPAEDSRTRAYRAHLDMYYDAVIASLRDAEAILIFGPGEAKGELKQRLVKNKLGARIAGIEAADKMTDRQVAAKVRQHFA
jgi:hypothetical protein